MTVHDYNVQTISGEEKSLADYKGKVLLVVNTASKCGLKNQFNGLQYLHKQYQKDGLEVLGFPSNQFLKKEPGTNEEIEERCQVNFGISFSIFSKINVNGKLAHPLYKHLTKETSRGFGGKIKWNFTKFLINQDGKVIKRFSPATEPERIEEHIKKALLKDVQKVTK